MINGTDSQFVVPPSGGVTSPNFENHHKIKMRPSGISEPRTQKGTKIVKTKIVTLAIPLIFFTPAYLFAGPGGKIVTAVTGTLWGRIAIGTLGMIFVPLILYAMIKEYRAKRRAYKDLAFMAGMDPKFEWLKIKKRILDCFHHVHGLWRRGELSQGASWMTRWYGQNQQIRFLDRWRREGLANICKVHDVSAIFPILFIHKNRDGIPHEGSELIVSVTARMRDYLKERKTGRIVEGSRKRKDVESVWSFVLENGRWLVSNVEEDYLTLDYAELRKYLPPIEETLIDDIKANASET